MDTAISKRRQAIHAAALELLPERVVNKHSLLVGVLLIDDFMYPLEHLIVGIARDDPLLAEDERDARPSKGRLVMRGIESIPKGSGRVEHQENIVLAALCVTQCYLEIPATLSLAASMSIEVFRLRT
jgi:hypothetical protein